MKPFKRSDRVGELIKKTLSQILKKEIKDPRLETLMITAVKVSTDLRLARIYYITPGSSQDNAVTDAGLKKARGYVKRSLARQLGLRYMPDLKFFYDESFEYGDRIDKILMSIKADHESNNSSTEK